MTTNLPATNTTTAKIFGVYTHSRPDRSIFYVGKGVEKRSRDMKRNRWHDAIVAKYGKDNIGVKFIPCDSEESALEFEVFLISELRSFGVELTNMTDGGEGVSGIVFSAEVRAKRSAAQKGYKPTPEAIAKTAAARRGMKHTPESKAKMSASHKGKNLGELSAEHRANISKALMGIKRKPQTEEHRKKVSDALKGKKKPPRTEEHNKNISISKSYTSPETRAKMVKSHLGKKDSEETRKNKSDAQKRRQQMLREQRLVGGSVNE